MAEIEGNNKGLTVLTEELAAANRERSIIIERTEDMRASAMNSLYDMMRNQTAFLENISSGVNAIISRIDRMMIDAKLDRQRMNELLRERGSGDGTPPPPTDESSEDKGFFDTIKGWLASFRKNFLMFLSAGLSALSLSNFGFTGKFEKALIEPIRNFFSFIGNKLKAIGDFFKMNVLSVNALGKLERFKNFIKPVTDFFKGVGSTIARFGVLVGKILYPLALAMSAFDGFTEAKKTFEKSGSILKSVTMFIGGFVGSFIGEFMNLIKDGVAWMVKKLIPDDWMGEGSYLSEFFKQLDSFSFSDMIVDGISRLYDVVSDTLKSIFTEPITFIKRQLTILGMILSDIGNFIVESLRLDTLWENIKTTMSNFFQPVLDAFSWVGDKIGTFVNNVVMVFDTVVGTITSSVDWVVGKVSGIFDSVVGSVTSALDWVSEKTSGILDPIIQVFDDISTKISEIFNFDKMFQKVTDTLTYLFAEIGIPRVELDVPILGKVGFGPWYPFAPQRGEDGRSVSVVDTETKLETKSELKEESGEVSRSKKIESRTSVIDDTQQEASGTGAFVKTVETTSESNKEIQTTNKALASFDYETGEGRVRIEQSKFFDNRATDQYEEISNKVSTYDVGPVLMGQVRRLIDDGASAQQVEQFIIEKQKPIIERISSFLGFGGGNKEKETVADVLNRDPSYGGSETKELTVREAEKIEKVEKRDSNRIFDKEGNLIPLERLDDTSRQMKTEALLEQDTESAELKSAAAAPIVNVNNAPTSNVSNNSSQTALIENPSAEDGLTKRYGLAI